MGVAIHLGRRTDEVTSVAVGISMPADPSLPEAVHNQSCLIIGGVYTGDVDEGIAHPASTRMGAVSDARPSTNRSVRVCFGTIERGQELWFIPRGE